MTWGAFNLGAVLSNDDGGGSTSAAAGFDYPNIKLTTVEAPAFMPSLHKDAPMPGGLNRQAMRTAPLAAAPAAGGRPAVAVQPAQEPAQVPAASSPGWLPLGPVPVPATAELGPVAGAPEAPAPPAPGAGWAGGSPGLAGTWEASAARTVAPSSTSAAGPPHPMAGWMAPDQPQQAVAVPTPGLATQGPVSGAQEHRDSWAGAWVGPGAPLGVAVAALLPGVSASEVELEERGRQHADSAPRRCSKSSGSSSSSSSGGGSKRGASTPEPATPRGSGAGSAGGAKGGKKKKRRRNKKKKGKGQ
jgi:hypothetical protein